MNKLLALVLATSLLSACGAGQPEKSSIGVRKVALGLAYSDKDLKVDLPPEVIIRYLPALPDDIAAAFPGTRPLLPPNNPFGIFTCTPAAADAPVSDVAPSAITTPPKEGTYLVQNKGTLKIGGAIPITLPYPPFTKLVIRGVKVEDVDDIYAGSVRKTTFIAEDQILPNFKVVSTLQYDNGELSLLQRETVNDGASTFFAPTPAVEVFRFTGPGGSWQSAGIDVATENALVVQGKIGPREAIDVCGRVVDSLPVSTDEQQVDLANIQQSGTRAGQPTITNYAPQFGGLPVRREQHTTQVFRTDAGPLTLDTDVVSTLMSVEPLPPGALP
jgi:hypothetical protein